MAADPAKLEQFLARMVGDVGTALSAVLVVLGDRLGLYKALAEAPADAAELARRTGFAERYLGEWLAAQAASDYVSYDPATGRFHMTPEQAAVFADEGGPSSIVGAFEVVSALFHDEPRVAEAFRTGRGVAWHEHHPGLFSGTDRFFRACYGANLVSRWLPALDGVVAKLEAGASVADVGCGNGASTIMMAQAFPNSHFAGFDSHPQAIERAREAAREAGVHGRVWFETANANDYQGKYYDLVTFFDCLHDMGDPVGAAAHVRRTLDRDGTWMIVEPFAHDTLEDNLNPVGRMFYAASTMICTPASLAQEGGLGLGAQAGERRLREVLSEGGFSRVRRAHQSSFNMILEARL